MPVQIVINGENAIEAIKELSTLAAGINKQPSSAPTLTPETPEAPKNDKPAKTRTKTETVKKEPENEFEDEDFAQNDDPDIESGEIPSVVELRAKAQEIGKTAEGKKAIKDLLNRFGSKSISDIPENKRAAFMRALEELA